VFVPDTVTGDVAMVRLIRLKKNFASGQVHELLVPSPYRTRPSCIVADKCGGCQLQHVTYGYQLETKANQVVQALNRIGGFKDIAIAPIIAAPQYLGYRNKVTYPLGVSKTGQVKAGYYRKGTHQIVNLNQCPIQDPQLNPLLSGVKQDLIAQNWPIYGSGLPKLEELAELRHLSFRIGRQTGEILLTLVTTSGALPGLELQGEQWLADYPQLVGVCRNYQDQANNIIFGEETECIVGQSYIREKFGGLDFQLGADTFFQIYTEQAEKLLTLLIEKTNLGGNLLLDAYCGIGTFSLPLAERFRQVIGLEVSESSIQQAQVNAAINGISNITFGVGKVEHLLPEMDISPDVVLLDPPRTGCDRQVLSRLLELAPQQIIYISCKPSTLSRDLQVLCGEGNYTITYVQPIDFFPQTAHVETLVILDRC
jgi:23S rRNA (uracil1939-C5)-methyltransferase